MRETKKKNIASHRPSLTELLVKYADITPDAITNAPTIELRGRCQLLICGCKEMLEYSRERVRVNTGCGVVSVDGRRLIVSSFCGRRVSVKGEIDSVSFGGTKVTDVSL